MRRYQLQLQADDAASRARTYDVQAANALASLPYGIGSSLLGAATSIAGKWQPFLQSIRSPSGKIDNRTLLQERLMSGFKYPDWLLQQEPEVPPAPSRLDPEAAFLDALGAEDAMSDFMAAKQAALHSGDDPLFMKQGRGALLAAPAKLEELHRRRDEIVSQAPPSRRHDLQERLDLHLHEAREEIDRHLAAQRKAWRRQTAEKRQAINRAEAALSFRDLDKLMILAGVNEDAAREIGKAGGIGPDSDAERRLIAQARSQTYRAAVEGALARAGRQSAIGLFDKVRNALSPEDAETLGRLIDDQRQRQIAQDYADRILPAMVATPADLDAAHAQATAQNETDWAEDATQRATNQHVIDVRFGSRSRGLAQARAELAQTVEDWIVQPAAGGGPQTERPSSAIWVQLGANEQKEVDRRLKENAFGLEGTDEELPSSDHDVAQSPAPFFARPPNGPRPPGPWRFKEPVPGQSGKEGAKDPPSWGRGIRPYEGETPIEAATRVMNERYGKDAWRGSSSRRKEFGKLQKYFGRHFRDPKELSSPYESPFGIPGEERVY